MLPPLQQVADEIFAILKNTFSQKLSLIELTARYNTSYHPDHPRVAKEQLLDALKKLPYIKVNIVWVYTCMYCCLEVRSVLCIIVYVHSYSCLQCNRLQTCLLADWAFYYFTGPTLEARASLLSRAVSRQKGA